MTGSRHRGRPAWARPATWVGPPLTTLSLAVLTLAVLTPVVSTTVRAADPPDQAQVLNCLVAQALPTPAAEATGGGFAFAYQSLGGLAPDGRSCTAYRLRNLPDSPPTPVRWLAGDEVLVDIARLKRCGSGADCAWFEVARYFEGEVRGGPTLLSFGLNADSFRLESDGLVARTAPNVAAERASVGTEVSGTLTLSDDTEVELDLLVKSRFERRPEGVALIYEVTSSDPQLLSGERLALVWQSPRRALGPSLPLPARSAPFLSVPADDAVVGSGASVSREGDTVALEVIVAVFDYLSDLRLSVVEAGEPGVLLLSVPLPAFVPAGP